MNSFRIDDLRRDPVCSGSESKYAPHVLVIKASFQVMEFQLGTIWGVIAPLSRSFLLNNIRFCSFRPDTDDSLPVAVKLEFIFLNHGWKCSSPEYGPLMWVCGSIWWTPHGLHQQTQFNPFVCPCCLLIFRPPFPLSSTAANLALLELCFAQNLWKCTMFEILTTGLLFLLLLLLLLSPVFFAVSSNISAICWTSLDTRNRVCSSPLLPHHNAGPSLESTPQFKSQHPWSKTYITAILAYRCRCTKKKKK